MVYWPGALFPWLFLSTLSVRRATGLRLHAGNKLSISIHALREESDGIPKPGVNRGLTFLSTLSVRRATAKVYKILFHFCAKLS